MGSNHDSPRPFSFNNLLILKSPTSQQSCKKDPIRTAFVQNQIASRVVRSDGAMGKLGPIGSSALVPSEFSVRVALLESYLFGKHMKLKQSVANNCRLWNQTKSVI